MNTATPASLDFLPSPTRFLFFTGKGGVGKTTIAAALVIGLVQRGHGVHLTTTDPAAHVAQTLNGNLPGLKVGRIDPKAETEAYIVSIAKGLARRTFVLPWLPEPPVGVAVLGALATSATLETLQKNSCLRMPGKHKRSVFSVDLLDHQFNTAQRFLFGLLIVQSKTLAFSQKHVNPHRKRKRKRKIDPCARSTCSLPFSPAPKASTPNSMQEIPSEHPKDIAAVLQILVRDGLLSQQNQRRWASYKVAAQDSPQSGLNIDIQEQSSPQLDSLTESTANSPGLLAIAEPARKNKKLPVEQLGRLLEQLCVGRWLSAAEIAKLVDRDAEKLQSRFLKAMVKEDVLELRNPDVRNLPDQAYRTAAGKTL